MIKLAQVHRVELGQPQDFQRPRTREEVLQKIEQHAGPAGRKLLENFFARLHKLERDQGVGGSSRPIAGPMAGGAEWTTT
jgi:hypothetical protein